MERIESLQGMAGTVTGVPTGFVDLDRMTAGLQKSELVILAARPSMGKTAFALNVVQHAAIEHGVGVAIFSLEMSKDQLVQRLLCSEGLVDASACGAAAARRRLPQLRRAPPACSARRRSGSTTARRSRRSPCAPKPGGSKPSTISG